ncbi:VWA domain-containing protein [Rothia sp. P6271]|uniref:VWA domain-containing protein n=1 Tax=unclassified Rothia (in: high G+C Gram-positive bacteria) TaxID=2689056 RepID=UPI003AC53F83
MGNAQSRREAREAQRRKNMRKWAAVGGATAILLSGGMLAYYLKGNNTEDKVVNAQSVPTSCATTQRVTVETTPDMAQVLHKIPVNPEDCIVLAVSHDTSVADVASQIIAGKSAPNLWLPASSTQAQLALAGKTELVTKAESLAKTPSVIVTKSSDKYPSWNEALSDVTAVHMGDPSVEPSSFMSIVNATEETANGKASKQALANNLGSRAQTIGVETAAENAQELLSGVVNDTYRSAIVGENDYASYLNEHSDSKLTAYVPATGSGELDYPLYQPASSGTETNKTVSQAADKITKFISSEDGKKALAEAGLRNAQGDPLEKDSIGKFTNLTGANPDVVAEAWSTYSLQAAPLNALVAVDVSGSMGYKIDGTDQTRMDIAVNSILAGYKLFPARDSMGLWSFSSNMSKDDSGKTVDYKSLAPIRHMSDEVDGRSQRNILLEAGSSLKPIPDNYTGLNDTILAAFQNVKKEYKAGAANTVIVMTDGENHDDNSISTEDLIKTIQSQQDPEAPVYIILIGISPDADMQALQEIASQTGGQAFPANSAEDIQRIFAEAFSFSSQEKQALAQAGAEEAQAHHQETATENQ